jgi:O-antigen ligase
MAFLLPALLPWKKLWIIPLIALILVGTGYKMRNHLPASLRKNLVTHTSTLFRLESYPLAAHIFLKKPLFGIGLHAPITEYLKDYRQKITKNRAYSTYIKNKKTLENIILCGFVGMGGLFTISYIALIIYILKNLFRYVKQKPAKRLKAVMFLVPLFGFVIHSMTFDSLLFPHLNWLFHSFLGIMANFDKNCLS